MATTNRKTARDVHSKLLPARALNNWRKWLDDFYYGSISSEYMPERARATYRKREYEEGLIINIQELQLLLNDGLDPTDALLSLVQVLSRNCSVGTLELIMIFRMLHIILETNPDTACILPIVLDLKSKTYEDVASCAEDLDSRCFLLAYFMKRKIIETISISKYLGLQWSRIKKIGYNFLDTQPVTYNEVLQVLKAKTMWYVQKHSEVWIQLDKTEVDSLRPNFNSYDSIPHTGLMIHPESLRD